MLAWIVGRLDGTAQAESTALGELPTRDSLPLDGLDVGDQQWQALFGYEAASWLAECDLTESFFARFADRVPSALRAELADLRGRLTGAK